MNNHTHRSRSRALVMYIMGFSSSVILTISSYILVTQSAFSTTTTAVIIAGLAIIQAIVQLVFFLHLSQESRPRWRLLTMLSMIAILIVVVFGSLWIMNSLDERMMPTEKEMIKYMDKQAGF